uniref:Uncharacterized protein n=1 Tax=Strombidium rassoulzadegani TaxID=1082188 RepID=A0A7S3CLY8_9SPIT|mmetsp:Transcript_16688/g.28383  ORF Transcript_16688/g.28383 Transcript_16688/m.28383 type:complete len:109 (+) Transcript_16688:60-386(+)
MKANYASLERVNNRQKTLNLARIHNYVPRDDKMFQDNEMYRNILLDNTKEERMNDQHRKNKERLERARLRTQNDQRQSKYKQMFFSQNRMLKEIDSVLNEVNLGAAPN